MSLQGEPSTIKTVRGISFSTGKVLQGELMFGRTDRGKPMFWLQGQDKNYALRGADGKPVTNVMDAEARAIKLINGGGATQLRQTSEAPGSSVRTPEVATKVKAPNRNGKLRINLEDPALNSEGSSGASKGGMFGPDRGECGPALTSGDAVRALRGLGLQVTFFNTNAKGQPKNAQATINRNPGEFQSDAVSYSLPKGSRAAFRRGCNIASAKYL